MPDTSKMYCFILDSFTSFFNDKVRFYFIHYVYCKAEPEFKKQANKQTKRQ